MYNLHGDAVLLVAPLYFSITVKGFPGNSFSDPAVIKCEFHTLQFVVGGLLM